MVANNNIPQEPDNALSENPLEHVEYSDPGEINDAMASQEASGTITKGTCNSPKVGHNIEKL